MAINYPALERKLAAIQSKNLDKITADQITLPFLTKPYTKAQLQAWMDKRTSILINGRTFTEPQILSARTTLYSALDVASKLVADDIIANRLYSIPENVTSANYDRLVGIALWTLIIS